MAPRKNVPSLQKLCLRYVSSNLDVWCPKQDDKYSVTINSDNQVSRLPNTILNDICARALQTENLPLNHLKAIIHKNTDQLDITKYTAYKDCGCLMSHAVEVISNSCNNLTTINLSRPGLYPRVRRELIESNPLLESVNYKTADIGFDDLMDLANNCPKLRVLDLCNTLTADIDVSALCIKDYSDLCGNISLARCCDIQKLFVTGTWITDEGAATALLNLPELRHFGYRYIVRVIENIYKEHNVQRKFKLENVNSLDTHGWKITSFSIDAVIDLCPNVTKVKIHTSQETDEWLPRLANFSRLEKLMISRSCGLSYYPTVNFHTRFIPVLKIIGNNLTYLRLDSVGWIYLLDIGKWCTGLSRLELIWNSYYSSVILDSKTNSRLIFGELRYLYIRSDSQKYIPSDQLETLLSNCGHVQKLYLYSCPTLTDELLLRVFQCNSFSELYTFYIRECRNVHMSSILSVLLNSDSIKEIYCYNCAGIDTAALIELQNLIREENFDVALTYPVRRTVSEMLADILNSIN